MPEINGIAHIQLTVTDLDRSIPFYRTLLTSLGLTIVWDNERGIYGVGGRTGILITECAGEHRDQPFDQTRPGLHHFCLRARSREDVEAIHDVAVELGASIIHGPKEDGFAPGYYSVLFEDPDGIRIEANHVPGAGLLAPGKGKLGKKDTHWQE